MWSAKRGNFHTSAFLFAVLVLRVCCHNHMAVIRFTFLSRGVNPSIAAGISALDKTKCDVLLLEQYSSSRFLIYVFSLWLLNPKWRKIN
jgi:hypothetical protein